MFFNEIVSTILQLVVAQSILKIANWFASSQLGFLTVVVVVVVVAAVFCHFINCVKYL